MKLRYIVSTFVEAESIEEALKKAKRIKPHELSVHNSWWEKHNYSSKDEPRSKAGFKN